MDLLECNYLAIVQLFAILTPFPSTFDLSALTFCQEGQTIGADLLRSIRNTKSATAAPPTVPTPAAPPLSAVAPVAAPVAVPPAVAAAQAVAVQAMAKQVAAHAAQSWAANAAAHAAQVHCARLAAAQLAAQAARLDPRFVEDPNAWLRIEAPVFQPGARQDFVGRFLDGFGWIVDEWVERAGKQWLKIDREGEKFLHTCLAIRQPV